MSKLMEYQLEMDRFTSLASPADLFPAFDFIKRTLLKFFDMKQMICRVF